MYLVYIHNKAQYIDTTALFITLVYSRSCGFLIRQLYFLNFGIVSYHCAFEGGAKVVKKVSRLKPDSAKKSTRHGGTEERGGHTVAELANSYAKSMSKHSTHNPTSRSKAKSSTAKKSATSKVSGVHD